MDFGVIITGQCRFMDNNVLLCFQIVSGEISNIWEFSTLSTQFFLFSLEDISFSLLLEKE